MKRLVAVVFASALSLAFVLGADVKVNVKTATGPEDQPTTSFNPDTPTIFALFDTEGIGTGDKIRGALIAEDVGSAAPPNTKIFEKTVTLDEDAVDGKFSFSKPTKGWFPGKYRVEVYVNDDLAAKTRLRIEAGSPAADPEDKSSAEIPDKDQLKSLTEASLLSFGRAVKKEDFSEFYGDTANIWQKQTNPEKL